MSSSSTSAPMSEVKMMNEDWYGSAVLHEIRRLRKILQPIAASTAAPMEPVQSNNTLFPFVLMLGNHSSGKSSFINYLLGRKIQATGVAPTDDKFTIIGHGSTDADRNGPALVGDPDLGFQGLSAFGSLLVNHTQLKLRKDIAIRDFMIVDSPGMIDSPGLAAKSLAQTQSSSPFDGPIVSKPDSFDRGYNFDAVIRWYAERADVIILSFDPEKPGSTGETLSILTNSLVGLDHKLLIVLNKADQLRCMNDYARAYGSLCWNLSKVIPRKDLPKIFTMCLPSHALEANANALLNDGLRSPAMKSAPFPALDVLDDARHEVIKEIFNAPKRRVDNEISRLTNTVQMLQFHCKTINRIAKSYTSQLWYSRAVSVMSLVASVGLTLGVHKLCEMIDLQSIGSTSNTGVGVSSASEGTAAVAGGSLASTSSATTVPAFSSPSSSVWSSLQQWCDVHRHAACVVGTAVVSTFGTSLTIAWQQFRLKQLAYSLCEKTLIHRIVRDVLSEEYSDSGHCTDEHSIAIGEQIAEYLPLRLNPSRIEELDLVPPSDFEALRRILSEDVAAMRRQVAPTATPVHSHNAHVDQHVMDLHALHRLTSNDLLTAQSPARSLSPTVSVVTADSSTFEPVPFPSESEPHQALEQCIEETNKDQQSSE